jgi:hypothetical protein
MALINKDITTALDNSSSNKMAECLKNVELICTNYKHYTDLCQEKLANKLWFTVNSMIVLQQR